MRRRRRGVPPDVLRCAPHRRLPTSARRPAATPPRYSAADDAVCVQGRPPSCRSVTPRMTPTASTRSAPAAYSDLGCLRTDVETGADEGVCITGNPCTKDIDCHDPVQSTCAATFLDQVYAAARPTSRPITCTACRRAASAGAPTARRASCSACRRRSRPRGTRPTSASPRATRKGRCPPESLLSVEDLRAPQTPTFASRAPAGLRVRDRRRLPRRKMSGRRQRAEALHDAVLEGHRLLEVIRQRPGRLHLLDGREPTLRARPVPIRARCATRRPTARVTKGPSARSDPPRRSKAPACSPATPGCARPAAASATRASPSSTTRRCPSASRTSSRCPTSANRSALHPRSALRGRRRVQIRRARSRAIARFALRD